MKNLLKIEERERLQRKYQNYPLLLASSKIITPVKSKLNGLIISAEDLFFEVSKIVDYILFKKEDVSQKYLNGFWTLLVNDIHELNPNTDDKTKNLLAGTVFLFTKEIFAHHCETVFKDTITDMLSETLENHLGDYYDDEVYKGIIRSLIECSQLLSKWTDEYEESSIWLSDEIAGVLFASHNNADDKKEIIIRVVDEEKLSSHFKVNGFDKKTHIPVLKAMLEQNQGDKNLARVALIIHESPHFIKNNNNKVFSKWYKEFCVIVGSKYHDSYEPSKLKDKHYCKLKSQYWFLN